MRLRHRTPVGPHVLHAQLCTQYHALNAKHLPPHAPPASCTQHQAPHLYTMPYFSLLLPCFCPMHYFCCTTFVAPAALLYPASHKQFPGIPASASIKDFGLVAFWRPRVLISN
eukprot:1137823-Pelagomonas_calceolata.AAC.2